MPASSATAVPLRGVVIGTLRTLRTSALVWAIGGGVMMYVMAMSIATEARDFPGGWQALAVSVTPGAAAMRILRWPAERLDTLGGYVTYHNVILVNLFLAIYGAVQGARAIRGDEERHVLEELLATGISRGRVLRDRTAGFAIAMAGVCLGMALGVAAGLSGGGEPDLVGALITLAASGLAAMVGFGFGLVAGQLTTSARSAAGASSLVVVALYVVTNVGDELGPLAFLQYLSPFTYANFSRALVPGYGFDPLASAVLVAMAVTLSGLAWWAFVHRDYGGAAWGRRPTTGPAARAGAIPTAMLSSIWSAALRRGRYGLIAWAAGAGALSGLMALLRPAVIDAWSAFDFIGALTGGGPGDPAETLYWSFVGALVAPVIAAYVVVQASGWVADLAQGRVELLLAAPVSWTRLVAGRVVGVVAGALVVTLASLGTLSVAASAGGTTADAAGLGRLMVVTLLFAAALAGVAAVVVAWVRRGIAVTVLAVVVGSSYLVGYLVPFLDWPDWLTRLSLFWAFGQPYLEWPTTARLGVLLVVAVPGAALAAVIAERTPKVA